MSKQTHEALCALCQLEHDNLAITTVPALVWQMCGDDAVLIGFNEAMVCLTTGGIESALGRVMSDFSGPQALEYLLECDRTHEPVAFESVRRLRTGPGTYRLLSVFYPDADGRIVLYALPLETIKERERKLI